MLFPFSFFLLQTGSWLWSYLQAVNTRQHKLSVVIWEKHPTSDLRVAFAIFSDSSCTQTATWNHSAAATKLKTKSPCVRFQLGLEMEKNLFQWWSLISEDTTKVYLLAFAVASVFQTREWFAATVVLERLRVCVFLISEKYLLSKLSPDFASALKVVLLSSRG